MDSAQTRADIDKNLKAIVQGLYNLVVQTVDNQPDIGQDVMRRELHSLYGNLQNLNKSASDVTIELPPDIIKFVEEGRNPDIHQRQFVEETQKFNQRLNGRTAAYSNFRDLLGKEISNAVPELKPMVKKIVKQTGGPSDD